MVSFIINFYRPNDLYGYLSNFARYPITIDNKIWDTSEHYFQAMKFDDETIQEKVRSCKTPAEAAKMGRSRSLPLRSDWEEIKEDVMYKALHAKFTQHPDLKDALIKTGICKLVEHTKNDSYWGDGGDGSGKNRLGYLLEVLREELRSKL